jgi:spore germination protein YaaH
MALADKLAHLGRGADFSGMGRRISGWTARGRRHLPVLLCGVAATTVLVASGVTLLGASPAHAPKAARPAHHQSTSNSASALGNRMAAVHIPAVSLPAATGAPIAAPVALVNAPPLASRENFAFAPYWTLPQSASFPLTGLSTIDYFAIGVNPNGTLDESGSGWNGYESQALVNLITRAHAAGERVVLTVNDFGQSSLNALTASPTAPATLAAALIPVLEAKNLDGLNLDLEGTGAQDQVGLTHLVSVVSATLKATNPHWQITMDTYASSAGDPDGFYNIPALAPFVDAFFVMAYELNLEGQPTPSSPLTSGMFSDLTTVEQYVAAVPATKVILGSPFFGVDWPTNSGTLVTKATGPAIDIADSQVQSTTHPSYWDPTTDSGWTSYKVGNQWHESYYESAYGLYMVAKMAAHYGIRGVGIWALGMEDDATQMISALDGFAPPGGPGVMGPVSTTTPTQSTTTTASSTTTTSTAPKGTSTSTTVHSTTVHPTSTTSTTSGYTYRGTWAGAVRLLRPAAAGSVNQGLSVGTLTGFSSTDPAYSCLDGKTLSVYLNGLTGTYVAVALKPTDCVSSDFIFSS